MSWEDYHLHEFTIKRRVYSVPHPDDDFYERTVIDEGQVRLNELVQRVGALSCGGGQVAKTLSIGGWSSARLQAGMTP